MDAPIEIKDPKHWAAFEKYIEWLSLPRFYTAYPKEKLEEKGFNAELIELLHIKYKQDFAAKFCVSNSMLLDWDKHPELQGRIKSNWKRWTKMLTPGIMGKFYEKLMQEADPARMKIWLEHVEEENKPENTVNVNIGYDNLMKSIKEDEAKENGKETK